MLAAAPHWNILGWSFLISTAVAVLVVLTIAFSLLRQAAPASLTTQLSGLGTDWSFTNNWVGTVTVGSGLLVGLLATSGILKSVLGSSPKAALGLMAVGGAVAAVLVGMAPVIIKLFGPDLNVPTVGGMLAAAAVTVVGTVGQLVTMTWQVASFASSWMSWVLVAIGCLTGIVVVAYAYRALRFYIRVGTDASFAGPATPGHNALL